jgi:tetratricopeptide (TPR) repeat protein
VPPDPDEHTDEVVRRCASLAAVLVVGGLAIGPGHAGAAPKRDGDAHDHGEFWSDVVSPHHDEVSAIKVQLRDALAVIAADWSPEHRERVLTDATRLARHARQLDGGDVEVIYYLGALADEGGRSIEAMRALSEASQRLPRGAVRSDALLRLGKIALRRGKPTEAIVPLRQALGERADRRSTTVAAVYLAHALDDAGLTADAIDVLRPRVEAASGNWDVEEALEWLTLAILYDRDEQVSLAFDLVVRAQTALTGSYAERMEAGLALAPPVPAAEIHYARGFLYETAGFVHEARAEWAAYTRLPSASAPSRARAHLETLDRILAERRPGKKSAPAPAPAPRRNP